MSQPIQTTEDERAVRFAAEELARYLARATGEPLKEAPGGPLFSLAVLDGSEEALPPGFGPEDDWIVIRPRGEGYLLGGSNPRSVLFAVYRYLREVGFRWIRPGPAGEVIPRLSEPVKPGLEVLECASYRFRTLCIEGACSEKHVRNLIDWAAKHAMNGYFIQFRYGTSFWRNWYRHADNPYMEAEPFSEQEAVGIVGRVIEDLELRDMRLERVGHGWTAAAVGITGEGWDTEEPELSPEQREMLAQIDGTRQLFHGVPTNTNLCYSNPAVRRRLVEAVVSYAREHPEVDALHLWLADGANNNCECEKCRAARPSDFYVQMLNELDEALTQAGVDTRIVFLIYVDLLWPPLQQRLHNPDRFILMFAPITRSYQQSLADATVPEEPLPDYRCNQLEFPSEVGMNVKFLQAWQDGFSGEGFDFDYHNIWACHFDPNHYALARVLHEDIRNLAQIGLQGLNSCQVQRLSFPHSLLLDVLAETLWNKDREFEAIASETFRDAFGEGGARMQAFFRTMSELWVPLFEPVFVPQPDQERIKRGRANLGRMKELVSELRPFVGDHLDAADGPPRLSWQYADRHLDLLELLIPALHAYLEHSPACRERYQHVFDFLRRHEEELHEGLDVDTFIKVQQRRINEV